MDYRSITGPGAERPIGGIFGTDGQVPEHAAFYILVANVGATAPSGSAAQRFSGQQAPRSRTGCPVVRLAPRPLRQPVRRVHTIGGLRHDQRRTRPRRTHPTGTTPET